MRTIAEPNGEPESLKWCEALKCSWPVVPVIAWGFLTVLVFSTTDSIREAHLSWGWDVGASTVLMLAVPVAILLMWATSFTAVIVVVTAGKLLIGQPPPWTLPSILKLVLVTSVGWVSLLAGCGVAARTLY
jgi:hypothetical protein